MMHNGVNFLFLVSCHAVCNEHAWFRLSMHAMPLASTISFKKFLQGIYKCISGRCKLIIIFSP